MNRLSPQTRPSVKELVQLLDRVAGHLNALLLVVALGLATLDFTLYVTEKVVDSLPPIAPVSAPIGAHASAAAATPHPSAH